MPFRDLTQEEIYKVYDKGYPPDRYAFDTDTGKITLKPLPPAPDSIPSPASTLGTGFIRGGMTGGAKALKGLTRLGAGSLAGNVARIVGLPDLAPDTALANFLTTAAPEFTPAEVAANPRSAAFGETAGAMIPGTAMAFLPGGQVPAILSFAGQSGEEAAQRAIELGHPEQADTAALKAAGITAGTQAALGPLGKLGGVAKTLPGTLARSTALLAGQTTAEVPLQNLAARSYDPNRPVGQGLKEGLLQSLIFGPLFGASHAFAKRANSGASEGITAPPTAEELLGRHGRAKTPEERAAIAKELQKIDPEQFSDPALWRSLSATQRLTPEFLEVINTRPIEELKKRFAGDPTAAEIIKLREQGYALTQPDLNMFRLGDAEPASVADFIRQRDAGKAIDTAEQKDLEARNLQGEIATAGVDIADAAKLAEKGKKEKGTQPAATVTPESKATLAAQAKAASAPTGNKAAVLVTQPGQPAPPVANAKVTETPGGTLVENTAKTTPGESTTSKLGLVGAEGGKTGNETKVVQVIDESGKPIIEQATTEANAASVAAAQAAANPKMRVVIKDATQAIAERKAAADAETARLEDENAELRAKLGKVAEPAPGIPGGQVVEFPSGRKVVERGGVTEEERTRIIAENNRKQIEELTKRLGKVPVGAATTAEPEPPKKIEEPAPVPAPATEPPAPEPPPKKGKKSKTPLGSAAPTTAAEVVEGTNYVVEPSEGYWFIMDAAGQRVGGEFGYGTKAKAVAAAKKLLTPPPPKAPEPPKAESPKAAETPETPDYRILQVRPRAHGDGWEYKIKSDQGANAWQFAPDEASARKAQGRFSFDKVEGPPSPKAESPAKPGAEQGGAKEPSLVDLVMSSIEDGVTIEDINKAIGYKSKVENPTPGSMQSIAKYGQHADDIRTVKAVQDGTKPASLDRPKVVPPDLEVVDVPSFSGEPTQVLVKKGNTAAVERVRKAFASQDEAELGRALGFTEQEVAEYMDRLPKVDAYLRKLYNEKHGKGESNALQKPSPTSVLQRQPQQAGETGSERGRVQPSVKGNEPSVQERPDNGGAISQEAKAAIRAKIDSLESRGYELEKIAELLKAQGADENFVRSELGLEPKGKSVLDIPSRELVGILDKQVKQAVGEEQLKDLSLSDEQALKKVLLMEDEPSKPLSEKPGQKAPLISPEQKARIAASAANPEAPSGENPIGILPPNPVSGVAKGLYDFFRSRVGMLSDKSDATSNELSTKLKSLNQNADIEARKRDEAVNKNLKGFSNSELATAGRYIDEMRANGATGIRLTPRTQQAVDRIQGLMRSFLLDENARGGYVQQGGTFRPKIIDPWYIYQQFKPEIYQRLKNGDSALKAQLAAAMRKQGYKPGEIETEWMRMTSGGNYDPDLTFGALRKPQGVNYPTEWLSPVEDRLRAYARKSGADIAFYRTIETDPLSAEARNDHNDGRGGTVPAYTGAAIPEESKVLFRNSLQDFARMHNTQTTTPERITPIGNALQVQTPQAVIDLIQTPGYLASVANPFKIVKALGQAATGVGSANETIQRGTTARQDVRRIGDIHKDVIAGLQGVVNLFNKGSGKEAIDRFISLWGTKTGDLVFEDAYAKKDWKRFERLGIDNPAGKSPDELRRETQIAVQQIATSSYNPIDQPSWLLPGSNNPGRPFLTLMRWSFGQTNRQIDHVLKPLIQDHNPLPLIYTLGMGYLSAQMANWVKDKIFKSKPRDLTMGEWLRLDRPETGRWLAGQLASMNVGGAATQLLSQLLNGVSGLGGYAPRNTAMQIASNIAGRFTQMLNSEEGASEENWKKLLQATLQDNSAAARAVMRPEDTTNEREKRLFKYYEEGRKKTSPSGLNNPFSSGYDLQKARTTAEVQEAGNRFFTEAMKNQKIPVPNIRSAEVSNPDYYRSFIPRLTGGGEEAGRAAAMQDISEDATLTPLKRAYTTAVSEQSPRKQKLEKGRVRLEKR